MKLRPFFNSLSISMAAFTLTASAAFAQSYNCEAGSVPLQVRAEGKTEQVGDISIDCTGPSGMQTANTVSILLTLDRPVTNPVLSDSTLRDVKLTIDPGSGPVASSVGALKTGTNSIAFNGVTFSAPSGRVVFRISAIRADVTGSTQPVRAFLGTNGPANLALNVTTVTVAQPIAGLFTSGTSIPIRCGRSILPSLDFLDAITQGTVGFTARAT